MHAPRVLGQRGQIGAVGAARGGRAAELGGQVPLEVGECARPRLRALLADGHVRTVAAAFVPVKQTRRPLLSGARASPTTEQDSDRR